MNHGRRRVLRSLLACGVLSFSGCGDDGPRFRNTDISGVAYGRDFALLDADGKTWRLEDFRGKAVMLFFGFIQCPVVCPTTLQRARDVRRLLGRDGERLQIVFITLDPERDTPEILREYTAVFDADVLGLYGTPEQTRKTAEDFRIYYRKVPAGGSYTLDHTATSYVYDPEGRLRLSVPHQGTAEAIADDVAILLHQSSTSKEGTQQ